MTRETQEWMVRIGVTNLQTLEAVRPHDAPWIALLALEPPHDGAGHLGPDAQGVMER